MSEMTPGWQADPTGRFEHRYWDGTQWTDDVSNAGVASTDPFTPGASASDAPAADDSGAADPTIAQPAAPTDPTAAWPTSPAPPVPPSAIPPAAPSAGGSNKRVLIGGIAAVVVVAVVAFLLLGGDDKSNLDAKNATDLSITVPDGGGEGAYGSNAAFDALYDKCADGDFQACDDLFNASPSGSEYEAFADTCGERNAAAGYCVDLYPDGKSDGSLDPGSLPADFEKQLADVYETSMGLSKEQAACLAHKLATVVESGELSQDQAMTEIFSYLSDCNIDMSDISGN
jgi:hypothetical protein